jgi:hypothetical protein
MEELGAGLNIKEKAIGQAFHLKKVPGQHVQLVRGYRDLFIGVEEFTVAANLPVILFTETFLHNFVNELHHCARMSLFAKLISLLVK